MIKKERLLIIFLAMLCLITGMWSGLSRIGWSLSVSVATAHHGAIMVGGFLGTLITLEKIIPLKRKILYLIPALNGISALLFFIDEPAASIYILIVSSAALTLVLLYYFQTQRTIIYALMVLGALCWLTGNILLLTKFFYPLAFPWWAGFTLFIITAERLELMKFLPVRQSDKILFVVFLFSFVVGILFSFHGIGNIICGLALIKIAIWLMKHDVVGINLKKNGMPKFVAIALISGYSALLLSGVFFIVLYDQGLTYDAIVHSFFIGFVFSMIFAHGPIILPGVLGISTTPFHNVLYYWLALLQISWLTRVFADVTIHLELRKISGVLTSVAILGYFVTIGILTIRNRKHAAVL